MIPVIETSLSDGWVNNVAVLISLKLCPMCMKHQQIAISSEQMRGTHVGRLK
jgi:hypothetical protein